MQKSNRYKSYIEEQEKRQRVRLYARGIQSKYPLCTTTQMHFFHATCDVL